MFSCNDFTFPWITLESLGMTSYSNPAPTEKLHFQFMTRRLFAQSARFSHLMLKLEWELHEFLSLFFFFNNGPCCCSVANSRPTRWPHGLQYTRFPCPSLSPGICSNSCPLNRWCHPTISSSVALNFSQQQGLFQWVGSLHQVAKVLELSLSPSNEYSGLISFRIDWFDLLAVQGILKSLFHHYSLKASIFGAQPSLWPNSHIHTWVLEKP